MAIESNKEIVLQFYRAFDERNIELAFSLLDDDFIAYMPGVAEPLDREGFKQFGGEFYRAFHNGKHTFDEIIVEGDKPYGMATQRIVTCGKFTAMHLGEFQGLPPTKRRIEISLMHIDRVVNGKIIEHWGQGDAQGLMKQIGIIFLPSPKLILNMFKNTLTKLFIK